MRQLTPPSNLVLSVLAGLGLLGSLTLPWYAAPVEDLNGNDGPVERAAFQIGKVFSSGVGGQVDGHDALGRTRVALLVLVVAIAVLGLAISLNLLREHAENALRVVAFAAPVILVVIAAAHPDTTTEVRIHYGMLVGFAAVLLMTSAAYHGASWRRKKAAPVRPRYTANR